jgi:hypothetical protein
MTPALNPNGVKGKPLDSNSLRRGESAAYALARLKRDAPDLAEKVIHGDVSAEARQKWNERRARILDALGLPDDAAAYRVTLHEPGTNQHSEVGHVGSTGAKYSTTGTAYTVARLA